MAHSTSRGSCWPRCRSSATARESASLGAGNPTPWAAKLTSIQNVSSGWAWRSRSAWRMVRRVHGFPVRHCAPQDLLRRWPARRGGSRVAGSAFSRPSPVRIAAHGVGFPAPKLADSRAVAELRQRGQQDPRLVECAIAHAAEQAIQPRYDGLKSFYDPQALGEHLTDIATTMLLDTSRAGSCSDDRGRWRAGLQRVADITHWMEALSRGSAVPHSHEDLVRRTSERGIDLGAADLNSQLGYLRSLPWSHLKGDRQRALLIGDLAAPAVGLL